MNGGEQRKVKPGLNKMREGFMLMQAVLFIYHGQFQNKLEQKAINPVSYAGLNGNTVLCRN